MKKVMPNSGPSVEASMPTVLFHPTMPSTKARRKGPTSSKSEPDGVVEAKMEINLHVTAEKPESTCEKCGRSIYPSQLGMRIRRNGIESGWMHSGCAQEKGRAQST